MPNTVAAVIRMSARCLHAALLVGLVVAIGWRVAAEEPTARRFRIGIVFPLGTPGGAVAANELRARGYLEGANVDIDLVPLRGDVEHYPAAMAELVRRSEDVILVAAPEAALRAAVAATQSIPLVIVAASYDPLARGYIKSLRILAAT